MGGLSHGHMPNLQVPLTLKPGVDSPTQIAAKRLKLDDVVSRAHLITHRLALMWSDAMTIIQPSPQRQMSEHNMCDRRATWSPLWCWPGQIRSYVDQIKNKERTCDCLTTLQQDTSDGRQNVVQTSLGVGSSGCNWHLFLKKLTLYAFGNTSRPT